MHRFDEPKLVEALLAAYREGAFPMAEPLPATRRHRAPLRRDTAPPGSPTRRIRWYSPDPRAIMPLDEPAFHISRSLNRIIRKQPFVLRTDTAFERVIAACAEPSPDRGGESGSWIDEQIELIYTILHHHGHAHSLEAWRTSDQGEERLVGGIYGVSIGAAFFAESMFCRPHLGGTDASKVCLVTLVRHLRALGYSLLDVQMANAHTARFGVREIPKSEYLATLAHATAAPDRWRPLEPLVS